MIAPATFDKERNAYFSGTTEYRRVSRVLSMLKVPFDKDGVSLSMAKWQAGNGVSVKEAQKKILASWDDMRDSSIEHGNKFHGICEDYFDTGTVTPGYEKLIGVLKALMSEYKKPESEQVIFYHKAKMAGTTDLRCKRQSGKNTLVDYFDFKTNERNGIRFDSIKRRDGSIKHNNYMMLPPVGHLEECNYNTYSLQLSIYAYMDEMENNYRIGKLGIIFIKKDQTVKYFPVPYMRYEAEAIIDHVMNIKELPR